MNIANYLTFLRIVLTFACVGLLLRANLVSFVASFVLFLIASLTDFLDGFLARRRGIVSDLGRLLDPIADKVLIIGIFLSFLVLKLITVWMVIIIMTREFLITGIRLLALSRGFVLEAQQFGKHKTFSQMLGINVIFIILIAHELVPSNIWVSFFYTQGISLLMLYIVAVTAFSGIHYLWTNRTIIRNF